MPSHTPHSLQIDGSPEALQQAQPLDLSHQRLAPLITVDPSISVATHGIELDPTDFFNLMLDAATVRSIQGFYRVVEPSGDPGAQIGEFLDRAISTPSHDPTISFDAAPAREQLYRALYTKLIEGDAALAALLDCVRHGDRIQEVLDVISPFIEQGMSTRDTGETMVVAKALARAAAAIPDFTAEQAPGRPLRDRSILPPTLPIIGTIDLPVAPGAGQVAICRPTAIYGFRETPEAEIEPSDQHGTAPRAQALIDVVGGISWINVDEALPRAIHSPQLNPVHTVSHQDCVVVVSPAEKPGDSGYYLRFFHPSPEDCFTAWYGTQELACSAADSFLLDVVFERAKADGLVRLGDMSPEDVATLVAGLPLNGTGQIQRVLDVTTCAEAIYTLGAGAGLRAQDWERHSAKAATAHLLAAIRALNATLADGCELFWDDEPIFYSEPGLYLKDTSRAPSPELELEPGTVEARMDRYGWITLRDHLDHSILQQDQSSILSTRAAVGYDHAEALDQGFPVVFAEPGYLFEVVN